MELTGRERDHARDRTAAAGEPPPRGWPGKRPRTRGGEADHDQRTPDLRALRASLGSGGAALPDPVAAELGGLLGMSLSDVRLHHGGAAGDAAHAMGAVAFTHGTDIGLAGELDVESAFGRHVLAHELIHVAQNKRGSTAMDVAEHAAVGPSGSAVEQEAELGAAALLAGRPFSVGAHGALPRFSRYEGGGAAPAGPGPSRGPSGPSGAPSGAGRGSTVVPGPSRTASPRAPQVPAPGSPGPTTGPAAPGRSPSSSTAAAAGSLDARVRAELEKRADPKLKADYAKATSQVDVLRIQALQYTFQSTGLWHTVVETFTAKTSFVDHWNQMYWANAYRGGHTWVDKLQAFIEGVRGALHLLGDVASVVSAWAGIAALITGGLALAFSETVIGGVALGAIAAVCTEVAVIAAAIKLALDAIDALLGFLQMVILIMRARASKDPAERARFAQLIHKEANDLASNVVSIGIQVAVIVASAGIGAGFSKGLSGEFIGAARGELAAMLKPAISPLKSIAGVKGLLTKAPVGKEVKVAAKTIRGKETTRAPTEAEIDKGLVGVWRQKRYPKGARDPVTGAGIGGRPIKGERELVPYTAENQLRGAKLVTMKAAVRREIHINMASTVVAFKGGWVAAESKGPREPSPPSVSPQGPGAAKATSDLSTVDVWPSQIEAFRRAKGPLRDAVSHMERQYGRAQSQLGDPAATQVRAAFDATSAAGTKTRFKAVEVQADAREGQASAAQGIDTTGKARTAQGQAQSKQSEIDGHVANVQAEGTKLHAPPPKDGLMGKVYNATIGKVGGWIGKAQKWVMNFVGKWAMSKAGFTKEELDLAGIENDMREDDKKDKTSEQQAGDTAIAGDQIQQKVFELQANRSRAEQYAIQGMVDAQRFIIALEEAQRALDDAIAGGEEYVGAVSPVIAHELDTKAAGKPIDSAYLAPLTTYATTFAGSIPESNVGAGLKGQGNEQLTKLKQDFPELDIGPGQAAIANAATSYAAAFDQLAGAARGNLAAFQQVLPAFVGTTDYDGVHENAVALDGLVAEFDKDAADLASQLVNAINYVLTQYGEHIRRAIDEAERTPDDPQPAAADPHDNPPGGN